jgi:hypothetical protein
MKIYIQNGHNKRVFNASNNVFNAAKQFIKSLIVTNSEGDEMVELSPVTLVSKCGFMKDLQEMTMCDEIDGMKCFDTVGILKSIGRNDIAEWMENCPIDDLTKKLFSN